MYVNPQTLITPETWIAAVSHPPVFISNLFDDTEKRFCNNFSRFVRGLEPAKKIYHRRANTYIISPKAKQAKI